MPIQKFITTEKLVEYLDQEVGDLLSSHDLYDIGDYGWLSEDTVDPDYSGHAIWQTSPPIERDWEYLFGKAPIGHRPTEKEKRLTVAGSDFEGLMRASRLSIGLCLLHKSIAMKKVLEDNHYFWLHHTDSIIQLNMASDRIREYFLVSFFGKTLDEYKKEGKNNHRFVTPFNQVRDQYENNQVDKNISNIVAALPDIAAQIYSFRKSRNGIVHEISTKLGKFHKEFVESQQHAFDSNHVPKTAKDEPDHETIRIRHEKIEKEHKQELCEASKIIIKWYKILIKFSSYVFELEHWLRNN